MLFSKTRLRVGVLGSAEKRFARSRHHVSPNLSLPVCKPAVGRRYAGLVSLYGETAAHLGLPRCSNTQVKICNCIPGSSLVRNSDVRLAKFVVDVDTGNVRRNGYETVFSVVRRRDFRRLTTMPLRTCPHRFATPAVGSWYPRLGSLFEETTARLSFLVRCDPQVWPCNCISDSSFVRNGYLRVGAGYF